MHTYRTHFNFFLLLAAAVALVLPEGAQAQGIQWRHNYDAAVRESAEKNRPIFVDFYTDNCIWCRKLDASTFVHPSVVELLNDRFVPLKLDANKSSNLTKALLVRRFPTLLFAAPDGTILSTQEGFMEPVAFQQRLNKVLIDSALQVLTRVETADAVQD